MGAAVVDLAVNATIKMPHSVPTTQTSATKRMSRGSAQKHVTWTVRMMVDLAAVVDQAAVVDLAVNAKIKMPHSVLTTQTIATRKMSRGSAQKRATWIAMSLAKAKVDHLAKITIRSLARRLRTRESATRPRTCANVRRLA